MAGRWRYHIVGGKPHPTPHLCARSALLPHSATFTALRPHRLLLPCAPLHYAHTTAYHTATAPLRTRFLFAPRTRARRSFYRVSWFTCSLSPACGPLDRSSTGCCPMLSHWHLPTHFLTSQSLAGYSLHSQPPACPPPPSPHLPFACTFPLTPHPASPFYRLRGKPTRLCRLVGFWLNTLHTARTDGFL